MKAGLVQNRQLGIIPTSHSGINLVLARMMKQLITVFLLGLLLGTTTQAGTYKWVDKDGNVVYSQHPPPRGQFESIQVKPAPRNSATRGDAGQTSKEFLENATAKRKNDSKLKAELKRTQELRDKNCNTAKKQLEFYTVYRRKKDKTGEYVRISDDEKAAGLKEAKQAIKDFCD